MGERGKASMGRTHGVRTLKNHRWVLGALEERPDRLLGPRTDGPAVGWLHLCSAWLVVGKPRVLST